MTELTGYVIFNMENDTSVGKVCHGIEVKVGSLKRHLDLKKIFGE